MEMELNEEEAAAGINLSEDWSNRPALVTASIRIAWDFDQVDRNDTAHCIDESGASSSTGLLPLPPADSDSDGPLLLGGALPTMGGDSEEEAPIQFGVVRHHVLATASDDEMMPDAEVQDEDAADQDAAVGTGSWEPGWNAGIWVTSARTPDEQSQVLICNAYMVAKRLPKDLLHALAEFFGRKKQESKPLRVAAGFLGVARRLLYETVKRVKDQLWAPVATVRSMNRAASRAAEATKGRADDEKQMEALITLVRASLSTGDAGYRSFTVFLARLSLAGVDIGDRYHSPTFAKEVVFLAARHVQALDVAGLRASLPGLGVRSSLALLLDGVPVAGVSCYGRHGSVIVICYNAVSATDGRLHPGFLCWSMPEDGHGGRAITESVMQSLAQQPLALKADELRKCLSLVGGDGAVVRGGGAKKNPGTQAAELIWRRVYGPLIDPMRDLGDDAVLAALADRPCSVAERDAWVNDAEHLHHATEWDKFHRVDISLTRCVEQVPLAKELFEVCKVMDKWFNLGEGRVVLKSAAEFSGIKLRSGVLPGLSRKVVALAREPGHLLDNFPAYALGIHGRTQHVRLGYHGPNIGELVDGGRRLSSLDLVAFTCVFKDVMSKVVAPWALVVQSSSHEPWVQRHREMEYESRLENLANHVGHVQGFVNIVVLLRQYVSSGELRVFVKAWAYGSTRKMFTDGSATSFGQVLPAFWGSLNDFLHFDGDTGGVPRFRGVELQTLLPTRRDPASMVCLGPHCQCDAYTQELQLRQRARAKAKAKAKAGGKSRGRGRGRAGRLRADDSSDDEPVVLTDIKYRGKRDRQEPLIVKGPLWVGHARSAVPNTFYSVRFQFVSKDQIPLQGRAKATYRDKIILDTPRCRLPWSLVAAYNEINEALGSAKAFLTHMLEEHRILFGSEGCNAGMQRAVAAMAAAFDWPRLVCDLPTTHMVHEFGVLAAMVLPYLEHVDWPSADDFRKVQHEWPPINKLQFQYVLLCRRLRIAGTRRTNKWWVIDGAVVQPLEPTPFAVWLTRNIFGPRVLALEESVLPPKLKLPAATNARMRRALLCNIAAMISQFFLEPRHFKVSMSGLAFVGYPWHGRKRAHEMRTSTKEMWRCRMQDPLPGGLVTLVLPTMVGKLAYVRDVCKTLDWSAVSASIDMDPFFSTGNGSGRKLKSVSNAWHAARIHNFCRPMGSPEAVCERIGTLMHMQWEATRHPNAGALMDEVLLRDAKVTCIGHPRDEKICRDVAKAMFALGRRPIVSERYRGADCSVVTSRTIDRARLLHKSSLDECCRHGHVSASSEEDGEEGDEDDGIAVAPWSTPFLLKSAMADRGSRAEPSLNVPGVTAVFAAKLRRGRVEGLPVFKEDPRQVKKDRAGSVKTSGLQGWLDSEEGLAWQATKRRRHGQG